MEQGTSFSQMFITIVLHVHWIYTLFITVKNLHEVIWRFHDEHRVRFWLILVYGCTLYNEAMYQWYAPCTKAICGMQCCRLELLIFVSVFKMENGWLYLYEFEVMESLECSLNPICLCFFYLKLSGHSSFILSAFVLQPLRQREKTDFCKGSLYFMVIYDNCAS